MDCNKAIHPIQKHVNESPCCKGGPKIRFSPADLSGRPKKNFKLTEDFQKKCELFL